MSTPSRITYSIRNITTGFLGQAIQTILGFVSRTIFIKCLATEYLGVSGLFTNILSILSLAELGVGSAIAYALYKPLADRDEYKVSALMNFYSKAYKIIGISVAIVGLSVLPFIKFIINDAPNIEENIYLIYFLYLFNTVITYFFSYKNTIIVGDQKKYISLTIGYIINCLQTISQVFILLITKDFLLYLITQSIFSVIYNISISITADKMYPYLKKNKTAQIDNETKKELGVNIKSLMIIKLSGVLVNNTDNIIISKFLGLSIVGLCSNYNLLTSIITSVLTQLFSGITASVGNVNAKESNEKKEDIFNVINFINFWLFGFSAICIALLSNDVIKLWIGEKFVLPISIPLILAINFYMVGMQNAVWIYKDTMGLFKQGRYLLLVTGSVNIVLSIVLGKYIGLFGILVATAISRALTNTWYDPFVIYKYGLKKSPISYFIRYIKFAIIIGLILVINGFLCSLVKGNILTVVIMKAIICTLVSNIIIIAIFYKTNEFRYILNIVKRIIGNLKFVKDK